MICVNKFDYILRSGLCRLRILESSTRRRIQLRLHTIMVDLTHGQHRVVHFNNASVCYIHILESTLSVQRSIAPLLLVHYIQPLCYVVRTMYGVVN